MPDQTVEVSFDPNAEPPFTFVPNGSTMTRAGIVILLRRPAAAPWEFTDCNVKNDASNQFSHSILGGGNLLHIRDEFREPGRFEYTVTVKFGRSEYTSPDPVIVNDPGGFAT